MPLAAGRRSDELLRFEMRLDAAISVSLGLVIVGTADWLAELSGLSPTGVRFIGVGFIGISVAVFVAAVLPDIRWTGKLLMVGNLMFAALSLVALMAGWLHLTFSGVVIVVVTGLYTLCVGCFQVSACAD